MQVIAGHMAVFVVRTNKCQALPAGFFLQGLQVPRACRHGGPGVIGHAKIVRVAVFQGHARRGVIGADHQHFFLAGQLADGQRHAGRNHAAQHLHAVLVNKALGQADAVGGFGLVVIDNYPQARHGLTGHAAGL